MRGKLPWRVGPKERARGVVPDPYRVWLSEVMLQQTTVAAVKSYFEAFTAAWPTVADLAAAPRDDVMKAWAGLGYYARARNLHACAETIVRDHGGRFPETAAGLRALPGIGDYTAAAIAAIAFDEPAPVVDGNIERVIARLFAIETPLPEAKKIIREHQARLTPSRARRRLCPGDDGSRRRHLHAEAARLCRSARWTTPALRTRRGEEERYPVKAAKTERPTRYGDAFVAVRADGAVLLRQRPDDGLLGGMTEVPGSEWTSRTKEMAAPARRADSSRLAARSRHGRACLHAFQAGTERVLRARCRRWKKPRPDAGGRRPMRFPARRCRAS